MIYRSLKKYAPEHIKRIARNLRDAWKNRNAPDYLLNIETPPAFLQAIAANNWLAGTAQNITSQGGEDGIIKKILETIGITSPAWCVEFGACDGKIDSNTWDLINNHGWSAIQIEPIKEWFKTLQERYKNRADVYCFNRFVHWEGADKLDAIFAETPLPKDFALLVIDIDGNDYHVWEAMEHYHPHVVSIEFHRLIHPSVRFKQPKDFSLNRSASLGILYDLAKAKGYELVCAVNWNAFFVRRDHFAKFNIADNRPEKLFHAIDEMRIFQGYEGTLRLCGTTHFYWKYIIDKQGKIDNVQISQRDIQVLPDGLRVFRPRHTYQSKTLAAQAGKLDAARVSGNIFLNKRRNETSECGEDGILEAIFTVLGIEKGFAVDVGACDGKWASHTWNLFIHNGWRGLAIEKDKAVYDQLADRFSVHDSVQCIHKKVQACGPSSLSSLLKKHKVPEDFAFLTIDVEGNDYHLWKSLKNYRPMVVAIDFNPTISNDIVYVQKYNTAAPFGASLRALIALGKSKGYELVAVTEWNAIFVRSDHYMKLGVTDNAIDNMYYPPFEMRMTQMMDGTLHLLANPMLIRQDYPISFEDFQVLPEGLRGLGTGKFGQTPTLLYNAGRP